MFNSPSWWRYEMKTFSALLALCEGNPPATGGFPSQRPVTRSGALMFSFMFAWTNVWANNRNPGDLRRHGAHYDVIVIYWHCVTWRRQNNVDESLYFDKESVTHPHTICSHQSMSITMPLRLGGGFVEVNRGICIQGILRKYRRVLLIWIF